MSLPPEIPSWIPYLFTTLTSFILAYVGYRVFSTLGASLGLFTGTVVAYWLGLVPFLVVLASAGTIGLSYLVLNFKNRGNLK